MLAVENLHSSYGRIRALKGVSLSVDKGELVAIVGANGAGKTTLLRAISGVQPLTSGRILFEGADITGLPANARVRAGIAQVPEGRQVFQPLTVKDNLLLGAYLRRGDGFLSDLERVYRLFPTLAGFRHRRAAELSGGQQQMLAIGRAFMSRPRLLLLDEPSMGLAPMLVVQVLDAVLELKAQGVTVLLVEQNAERALQIADRGYVIETGNIVLTGRAEALLGDDRVRSAYLGM
jgi:branched-chain amino acid transport system ATP-binding protein